MSFEDGTVGEAMSRGVISCPPETSLRVVARMMASFGVLVHFGTNTFLDREWAFNNPPLHLQGIISASIGIAQHLPSATTGLSVEQEKSELLRRADAAMYRAKSQGKNQVVVSKAGEDLSGARGALSRALP